MKTKIREDFLQLIWQTKNFDVQNLRTTANEELSIRNFGMRNSDAGPDFLDAMIEIDNLTWFGNIEVHTYSSVWHKHNHSENPTFNNTVLHVVYEEDQVIFLNNGSRLPCLELKGRIPKLALKRYRTLHLTSSWIPCASMITMVPGEVVSSTIHTLLHQRFTARTAFLLAALESIGGNFLELVYRQLAWTMGLPVNGDPMRMLAESIPYSIILKYRDRLSTVEALLFGQSGLLPDNSTDSYVNGLREEYLFYKNKHNLISLRPFVWKFMRMRPASFPTIRIAQLANILQSFARIDEILFIDHLEKHLVLQQIHASKYWDTHHHFGQPSTGVRPKKLGNAKIRSVVINTCVPLLYALGKWKHDFELQNRSFRLLRSLAPENNKITRQWKNHGIVADNAAETQSLLELKKTRCERFGCLDCPIGQHIISRV